MKEASKPFAWLVLEYLFGQGMSHPLPAVLPIQPESEEDQAGMKRAGVEQQLPQREEIWKWEIRG